MSNKQHHFYEFGPFRLDTEKRRVMRDGEIVSLTPKAFELLAVLVQHGGQLVEKDELMQQVWPETYVEEGNLSVHIFALRKALGQTSGGENYIETIPRLGFRFAAAVRSVEPNGVDLIVERHTRSQVTIEERESVEDNETASGFAAKLLGTAVLRRLADWKLVKTAAIVLTLLVVSSAAFFYFQNRAQKKAVARPVRSIAVLPFKPLSVVPGDEYLGVGLADALIIRLSSIKQVVVRPTSAVLKYSSVNQDLREIGRSLNVDAVLVGHTQRDGDRIRATMQLVSVHGGNQLWTGQFDENFAEIFSLQDSISAQIVKALSLHLSADESQLLTKHHTRNPEAFRSYLKGRYFWNKRTRDDYQKAIGHFQEALEIDPVYASAYAGLADCYVLGGGARSANEAFPKAKAAAMKALEIDETLSEAHTSLALVKLSFDWDLPGAEKEFKRAIELNPNYATAHHWYADYLLVVKRFDEAITEASRAQEIDPLSLPIIRDTGRIYYFARQYDKALERLQTALEMDPDFVPTHITLGDVYLQKGNFKSAIAEYQRAISLSGGGRGGKSSLAYIYAVSGKKEEAQKLLEETRILLEQKRASSLDMSIIYAGLGQKEQALDWLEKAYTERSYRLIYAGVEPIFDSLRSDPRFQDLLQRIGVAG